MTEPVEDHSILPEVEEAISDFLDQGERWREYVTQLRSDLEHARSAGKSYRQQRDAWKEDARRYSQNADYWHDRYDALVTEVKRRFPSSDFLYYPLQGELGPDTPRPSSSEIYGLPKICEIPDCGCAGNAHP